MSERANALKILSELSTDVRYRLTKVEARRNAWQVVQGDSVVGRLKVLKVDDFQRSDGQFNHEDFMIGVSGDRHSDYIRTSLVQSASRTDKGVEITTLNSLYLLEEVSV